MKVKFNPAGCGFADLTLEDGTILFYLAFPDGVDDATTIKNGNLLAEAWNEKNNQRKEQS